MWQQYPQVTQGWNTSIGIVAQSQVAQARNVSIQALLHNIQTYENERILIKKTALPYLT